MVIDAVGAREIVLEDPFHPRGTYPIRLPRERWDQVRATTAEYVKSEFERLRLKLPGEEARKDGADGKMRAVRNRTETETPESSNSLILA
jgi:hypothetical protein